MGDFIFTFQWWHFVSSFRIWHPHFRRNFFHLVIAAAWCEWATTAVLSRAMLLTMRLLMTQYTNGLRWEQFKVKVALAIDQILIQIMCIKNSGCRQRHWICDHNASVPCYPSSTLCPDASQRLGMWLKDPQRILSERHLPSVDSHQSWKQKQSHAGWRHSLVYTREQERTIFSNQ